MIVVNYQAANFIMDMLYKKVKQQPICNVLLNALFILCFDDLADVPVEEYYSKDEYESIRVHNEIINVQRPLIIIDAQNQLQEEKRFILPIKNDSNVNCPSQLNLSYVPIGDLIYSMLEEDNNHNTNYKNNFIKNTPFYRACIELYDGVVDQISLCSNCGYEYRVLQILRSNEVDEIVDKVKEWLKAHYVKYFDPTFRIRRFKVLVNDSLIDYKAKTLFNIFADAYNRLTPESKRQIYYKIDEAFRSAAIKQYITNDN